MTMPSTPNATIAFIDCDYRAIPVMHLYSCPAPRWVVIDTKSIIAELVGQVYWHP